MTKIHTNILIYYGCIVKIKYNENILFFAFCLWRHPIMRKTPPLCYTQNTAVSCKYFIGKIFYGYTKMYMLVMITTQLCCMETNTNQV